MNWKDDAHLAWLVDGAHFWAYGCRKAVPPDTADVMETALVALMSRHHNQAVREFVAEFRADFSICQIEAMILTDPRSAADLRAHAREVLAEMEKDGAPERTIRRFKVAVRQGARARRKIERREAKRREARGRK